MLPTLVIGLFMFLHLTLHGKVLPEYCNVAKLFILPSDVISRYLWPKQIYIQCNAPKKIWSFTLYNFAVGYIWTASISRLQNASKESTRWWRPTLEMEELKLTGFAILCFTTRSKVRNYYRPIYFFSNTLNQILWISLDKHHRLNYSY